MEEQLAHLLNETLSSAEAPRAQAEQQLLHLYANPSFPTSLASIASHDSVNLPIRQAALLALKTFVLAGWSPSIDGFKGTLLVDEAAKDHLRAALLALATSDTAGRRVQNAASYVVSKVAGADFPDRWPGLLPDLLRLVPDAGDARVYGALKVLAELVEDGFSEDKFFGVAQDLINTLFVAASSAGRKPMIRALAVSVFRGCFDTLEMVLEDHKSAVKGFAEGTLGRWMPFFIEIIKIKLEGLPLADSAQQDDGLQTMYHGLVALKLQVVKVLMRVRSVFPAILSPQTPALFSAIWEELSTLLPAYQAAYVAEEQEGRLEDSDGLPYTLDFLILEDLDFMQACLRAPPVRKQLEQQGSGWISEVVQLTTAYAQITMEEEGIWNFDLNVFLAEETSVTSNYTARTACGDLMIKVADWLIEPTIQALLSHMRSLQESNSDWRLQEASLYLLNQIFGDWQDLDRQVSADAAQGIFGVVRHAMQQKDSFLRARGYLVAATLVERSGIALQNNHLNLLEANLQAIVSDPADVVQVSAIRALSYYLQTLEPTTTQPLQGTILHAISSWISSKDLSDMEESDDLMITLLETLRHVILLDTRACLNGDGLSLILTIASHGAANMQLTSLATETFDEICSTIAALGSDAYTLLCHRTLPSLTGAFDIGNMTEENALTNLAADLLSTLAQHGSSPLPAGFAPAVLSRLTVHLLASTDEELLKSCTSTLKYTLQHDAPAVLAWRDDTASRTGLETILVVIDRLLSPAVSDHAAAEVGGLATQVVEKAGSDQLGPYLARLLQAVAARLESATQAHLIQSLVAVFARLAVVSPREVVDFLSDVRPAAAGQESGLQVVVAKWLENSVNFAGYEDIRQNVTALARLYELHDARLMGVMVRGELIVPASDRIMTRSKARQNPDRWTAIPAPLKMLKVLVEELGSPGGDERISSLGARGVIADGAEEDDEDDDFGDDDEEGDADWEDEPNLFDLGLGSTKAELMAFAEEAPASQRRQPDDDTQAYLAEFFRRAAGEASFAEMFRALSAEEQAKLRRLG